MKGDGFEPTPETLNTELWYQTIIGTDCINLNFARTNYIRFKSPETFREYYAKMISLYHTLKRYGRISVYHKKEFNKIVEKVDLADKTLTREGIHKQLEQLVKEIDDDLDIMISTAMIFQKSTGEKQDAANVLEELETGH